MAEVTLTPDTITRAGKAPTAHTSLSTSETYVFPNEGNVVLRVTNGTSAATKVTVSTTQTVDEQPVTNREVEVAKSTTKYIGPFPPSEFNTKGLCAFKLSAITEVTVELVQF